MDFNFFNRFFNNNSQSSNTKNKRNRNRSLRIEELESRDLLSAKIQWNPNIPAGTTIVGYSLYQSGSPVPDSNKILPNATEFVIKTPKAGDYILVAIYKAGSGQYTTFSNMFSIPTASASAVQAAMPLDGILSLDTGSWLLPAASPMSVDFTDTSYWADDYQLSDVDYQHIASYHAGTMFGTTFGGSKMVKKAAMNTEPRTLESDPLRIHRGSLKNHR